MNPNLDLLHPYPFQKLRELFAGVTPNPALRHVKIEDGPGRPLGRSFRVKLWPTLIVLRDGREVARVVRPTAAGDLREALSAASGG